jgi:broad specificity phosphatase PhoE
MIIHLVRHGQPQFGDDGLYLPDTGLTDLGRRQADRVALLMTDLRPDGAFSSDVPRAVETAECYSLLSDKTVRQIPALAEFKTGNIWDAPDSVKAKISSGDYLVDYKSMGGETILEFSDRAVAGFKELLDTSAALKYDRIVAFLHEGVIGAIIDHMEGRSEFDPKHRPAMPYGALTTIATKSAGKNNSGTRPDIWPGFWETGHLDRYSG